MAELKPIRDALADRAAADATRRAQAQTMRSDSPKWYLAHTGAGDSKAVERLRQGGFEVYYPQMRVLRPVPKRLITIKQRNSAFVPKHWVIEPLWRRYLFIR